MPFSLLSFRSLSSLLASRFSLLYSRFSLLFSPLSSSLFSSSLFSLLLASLLLASLFFSLLSFLFRFFFRVRPGNGGAAGFPQGVSLRVRLTKSRRILSFASAFVSSVFEARSSRLKGGDNVSRRGQGCCIAGQPSRRPLLYIGCRGEDLPPVATILHITRCHAQHHSSSHIYPFFCDIPSASSSAQHRRFDSRSALLTLSLPNNTGI